MTQRNIHPPHTRVKALRDNTGLHVTRPAPVAPCTTDDLYLPVETIRNIRHRRLLLLNQDETLFSRAGRNPDIQWGVGGAYQGLTAPILQPQQIRARTRS